MVRNIFYEVIACQTFTHSTHEKFNVLKIIKSQPFHGKMPNKQVFLF